MGEEYKDTKAGLIVIGIFEILGGLFCALFFGISVLSLVFLHDAAATRQMLSGVSVYGFLAVWLIWMGIGTIRARRGIRLLMLATSWIMLVCGMLAMVMMFFVMPQAFEVSEVPAEMMKPILVGVYVVLAVVYLLFPTIGILFYGNRNVRATFEHRDSAPSWMEGCPLPVLVLVMMLLLAAISLLMLIFMNCALPFWGIIVSGWAGAVVLLLVVGACLALAQGAHNMRPWAWWGVLALLLIGLASQLITYGRIDVMEYYRAMGYTDEMLLQLSKMEWVNSTSFNLMALFYSAPGFIYLLFIKRYFKSTEQER
ncbi:hypothetical protein P4B35_05880 [Pontiellaceae bacterium B12227]|nr:hypothetical protein [Pontiellaceae bacterium B12227]